MIEIITVAVIAAAGLVGTLIVATRDDYRRLPNRRA
jgi:hypothetical protein